MNLLDLFPSFSSYVSVVFYRFTLHVRLVSLIATYETVAEPPLQRRRGSWNSYIVASGPAETLRHEEAGGGSDGGSDGGLRTEAAELPAEDMADVVVIFSGFPCSFEMTHFLQK